VAGGRLLVDAARQPFRPNAAATLIVAAFDGGGIGGAISFSQPLPL